MPRASMGEILLKTAPQDYEGMDADRINTIIYKAMSDPEKRPRFIAAFKSANPFLASVPDDEIMERASIGSTTSGLTPDAAAAIRNKAAFDNTAKVLKTKMKWSAASKGLGQEDPGSRMLNENVPNIGSLVPGNETNRYRVFDDQAEAQKFIDENPGARWNQPGGIASFERQIVGPGEVGVPLGSLAGAASYKPEDMAGKPNETVTDLVKNYAENVIRHPLGVFTGESSLANRVYADALRRVTGTEKDTGPGLREATGDLMERANPEAMIAASKIPANLMYGYAKAHEGWDTAKQKLYDAVGAEKWANENAADATDWRNTAKNSESYLDYVNNKNMSPAERADVGAQAGVGLGRTVGEVAGMVAPNEADLLTGGASKALGPLVRAGLAGGYEKLVPPALGKINKAIDKVGVPNPLAVIFNAHHALGLKSELRDTLHAAGAAKRSSVEVSTRIRAQDLNEQLGKAFGAHGVSDEATRSSYLRKALEDWTSPEARRAADPVLQDIYRVLQPAHYRVWRDGVDKGLYDSAQAYNPFHVYRGQDPTKAARFEESLAARDLVESGGEYKPAAFLDNVDDVPGVDVMPKASREVFDDGTLGEAGKMYAARESKPFSQVAEQSLDLMRQGKRPRAEIAKAAKDYENMNALTGILGSHRMVDIASGDMHAQALKELEPLIKSIDLDETMLVERFGKAAQDAVTKYGDPRLGKSGEAIKMARGALERWMIDNDKVILRAKTPSAKPGNALEAAAMKDAKLASKDVGVGAIHGDHYVEVPEQWAQALNGKVVDRQLGKALEDLGRPYSDTMAGKAHKVAGWLDKMLGLSQQKKMITIGNMGFDWRNRLSELMRLGLDETEVLMKHHKELRKLVEDITNEKIGKQYGKVVELGGNKYTTGELHELMVRQGGIGGFTHDILNQTIPDYGSGVLLHGARIGPAIDKIAGAMMKPGEASSKVANEFFRGLFPGMEKTYTAEHGMRMLDVLAKMKRGVNPLLATRQMKTLFIDYGDKNAAELLLGTIAPFIKYYTGAIQGAVAIALKNPRKFSRLSTLARIIQDTDAAIEGGALDPRLKPASEQLALSPMVTSGGKLGTLRIENPWSELAQFAATMGINGIPDERNPLGKYMGPLITQTVQSHTGKNLQTGRDIFGLSDDQRHWAGPTNIGRLIKAYQDQTGAGMTNPAASIAYHLASGDLVPGAGGLVGGRVMSPQANMLMRALSSLGGSPAGRTEEDTWSMLQRAALAGTIGARMTNVPAIPATNAKLGVSGITAPQPKMRASDTKKGRKATP